MLSAMDHLKRLLGPLSFCLVLSSCGNDSGGGNDGSTTSADFPPALTSTFLTWTPVLNGDVAFSSSGHSGQTTRVYFNQVAAPHFKNEKALPFAEGPYVAKAVVANADTPASAASRVYFMLKKEASYDTENANWAYAVANLRNGTLTFDANQGKLASCSGCHRAETTWDYVRTVDYFRKQSAN